MTRQIDRHLKAIISGNSTKISSLCKILADRLLYIPVADAAAPPLVRTPNSHPSESINEIFKVVVMSGKLGRAIPIFTASDRFNKWAAEQRMRLRPITMLGSDLCLAIPENVGAVIDAGSIFEIELNHARVQEIAGYDGAGNEALLVARSEIPSSGPSKNIYSGIGGGRVSFLHPHILLERERFYSEKIAAIK